MKTVLLDANVVLDVLLDREPHATESARVWTAVEARSARGLLAAHAVTTIHYLTRKHAGSPNQARGMIASLLRVFGVARVDQAIIARALGMAASPDFEDAVTAAAAQAAGCDLIVTRDPKGFSGSPVRAVTPRAALRIMAAS